MPLFVPQWSIFPTVSRLPTGTGITLGGVMAMLLPFPLVRAQHPEVGFGTSYDKEHMTPFYYSGTLFFVVSLLAVAAVIVLFIFKRDRGRFLGRVIKDNAWLFLALAAFILALGDKGVLWAIQSKLPFLNKFRMPFKFLIFVNLFTIMAGGVIIERCIRLSPNQKFLRLFLAMLVICAVLYNVSISTASFYSYADRPGDLQLPGQMHDFIGGKTSGSPMRILSLVPERSPRPDYIFSLCHNLPSIFGVYAFGGYDPIIGSSAYFAKAKENLSSYPLEAAKAYAIQWVIVEDRVEEGDVLDPANAQLADFFLAHSVRRLDVSGFVVLELDKARPLAYAKENPRKAMPVYFRSDGMDIDVSGVHDSGGSIIINTLWWPGLRIIDGQQQLRYETDFWGRVVVDVPPQTSIIRFQYLPPWKEGFLAGASCLLCAVALYFLTKRLFGCVPV